MEWQRKAIMNDLVLELFLLNKTPNVLPYVLPHKLRVPSKHLGSGPALFEKTILE